MAKVKSSASPGGAPELYVPREYPLQVERTAEGETYYSKGWHDAESFAAAVIAYDYGERGHMMRYDAEDVRYDVWRVLPAAPGECYGVAFWFIPGQLGTAGAFPVTLVYA